MKCTIIHFRVSRGQVTLQQIRDLIQKKIKVPGSFVSVYGENDYPYLKLTIPGSKRRAGFLPGGAVDVIPFRRRTSLAIFPDGFVAKIEQPDGDIIENRHLCPNCQSLDTKCVQVSQPSAIYPHKNTYGLSCPVCQHEWTREW